MMKEMAEILIEDVRYSFDPETEYMKDGHAIVKLATKEKMARLETLWI